MELIIHQAMATTTTTTTTDHDFSFPAVPDSPPRFLDSPPLWRTPTPTPPHQHTQTLKAPPKEDHFFQFSSTNPIKHPQRKSFSCIEQRTKTLTDDGLTEEEEEDEDEDDEEEKMDMLWEDLNEEVVSMSRPEFSEMSPRRILQFGCVRSLKLSRTSGAVLSGKRPPGIVAFMKVLKKLFLIQSSHNSKLKIKSSW